MEIVLLFVVVWSGVVVKLIDVDYASKPDQQHCLSRRKENLEDMES